jgi:hypothetical protein
MQITEQMVTRFAIRARKIKLLEDAQKELRGKLVDGLKAGVAIPLTGPYTIGLSQNGGKDFSWEDQYLKLKIKSLRAEGYKLSEAQAIAEKDMKDLYEDAPDKPSITINGEKYVGGVRLTPKVNAAYQKQVAEIRAVDAA